MSDVVLTEIYFLIGTPVKELHQTPLQHNEFFARRPGSGTPSRVRMSCML
jgi:hypothetical protein